MSSSPIEVQQRIPSLDIIRGMALFGILLANMPLFQWPGLTANTYIYEPDLTGMDRWIRMFFDMFIETKFFSIFSFLFGLGFYLFMSRAEERGERVYRLFSRRMAALALFGLMHLVLFWYGDILLSYAMAGFILMLFYRRKIKTIGRWIGGMLVLLIGLISINLTTSFLTPVDQLERLMMEQQATGAEKVSEAIEVYRSAGYIDWLTFRLTEEVIPVLQNLPYAILPAIFMFLFGLYVGKRGIFQYVHRHHALIKRSCWIAAIISVPFCFTIMMLHMGWLNFGPLTGMAIQSLTTVSGPVISIFYMSGILLLLQRERWRGLFRPFGYAGRMALTNYISQTWIGLIVFIGLNLYGTMNLRLAMILGLIIYAVQIVWSHYWLKRYRFGPLEWLWRSLTYGRLQRMRKSEA